MSNGSEVAVFGLLSTFMVLFWCFILILIFALTVLAIWLFVACIIDVTKKDESTFKDKNLWLVILAVSFFFGMSLIPSLVYYFLYKPRFKFWQS